VGAKYRLEDVHEAARGERIELDSSRALDEVLRHFDTLLECYPFAASVLLELRAEHWTKSVTLPDQPYAGVYDEYIIHISEALATKHGVARDWYLKLRLYEALSGETVFLVSLHPPERPASKRGARKPGGQP